MNALLLSIILATSPNAVGGRIALTSEKCNESSYIAFSFAENGDTISGCWFSEQELVFIKWENGTVKTYPAEKFTLTKEAQAAQGGQ